MNYVFFLLSDRDDGTFSIEVLYEKHEADKLPQDMVWSFTDPQLDLLYELLLTYYLGFGLYYYRNVEALMELTLCESADDMLTLLSWSRN